MNSRIMRFILPVILVLALAGCGVSGDKTAASADAGITVTSPDADTAPGVRKDGKKFRLAMLDYDEYLPASRQLYYILSGLEELGWIAPGSLPFTSDEIDRNSMWTKDMYEKLSEADLGEYLEFAEDGFFYLGYSDEAMVRENLTERAGKDIDMILTFGTYAGKYVRDLDLPIPLVDFSATDPVASGIIDSAENGSGRANVWAQVEPSLPLRQIRYYHSVKPFKKLGIIVHADEIITGVPDIEASSREIGFELVKYFIEEQPRETKEELDAYYLLVEQKINEMTNEGIDAFFMPVDLINDIDRIPELLQPFYDKKIPVYLMDDVAAVKAGALMLISANDVENVGRFVADAIARILNGAEAGSLPCIYTSAPSIYVNYDIAKKIDYPLSFEFLAVCDEIFTGTGDGNEG
ncbi:MAG: hypothetical protein K6C95_07830 [Lachnospiraceae bacterium]|nr:hypothetical protein [Lachnospiraceae bacterium]